MKGELKMGTRNLLRNWRRSTLTILSIAIGCAGVIFIFGYGIRFERYLRVAQQYLLHSGHLAIYKEQGLRKHLADPRQYGFTAEEQEKVGALLQNDPDLERVTSYLLATGLISNGCKTQPYRAIGAAPDDERWIHTHSEVLSATPELVRMRGKGFWEYPDLEAPIMVSKGLSASIQKSKVHEDFGSKANRLPAVLDCSAPDLEARINEDADVQLLSASFSGGFAAINAEMVSLFTTGFSESEDNTVLLPLKTLQQMHDTDTITYFAVFLKDPSTVAAKQKALEAALSGLGLRTAIYRWDDPLTSPNYTSVVPMLKQVFVIIMVIMSTIVGFSVVNTMTMSIIERSREIGTLRALGFIPQHVMRLLLVEVSILTTLGIVVGLGLGMGAAQTINAMNIRFQPPAIADTIQFLVLPNAPLCLGVSVIILVVALTAAWFVSRQRLKERIVGLLYAGTT